MTWETFQNEAYDINEKEIEYLVNQVLSYYQEAIKDITGQIEKQYAKILAGVAPEDYYNEMIKYDRLNNLLKNIQASYKTYATKAGKDIAVILEQSFQNVYYLKLYGASWLVPELIPGMLPEKLTELVVFGTDESWKAITAAIEKIYGDASLYQAQSGTLIQLLTKNLNNEILQIRQQIAQGLLNGESMQQMASRIKDVIGRMLPEGNTGAMANALRIIRTETNRTMNAAALASTKYLESQGIDVKKRWSDVLDMRTRSTHAHLDGKTIAPDDYFNIGGDQALYPGDFAQVQNNANCRCTTIDIIDGEQPSIRTGVNPVSGEREYFNYKTYSEWATENGIKI